MKKSLIIVGAGVVGRLAAVLLRRAGAEVLVVDASEPNGAGSCTWVGAGMLSPYCERIASEQIITELGLQGCARWPHILATLAEPVDLGRNGSLVVAHPRDEPELFRLRDRVRDREVPPDAMQEVTDREIAELEPDLAGRFVRGLYFPLEGHIDNRALLQSLRVTAEREGVRMRFRCRADALAPGRVSIGSETLTCDEVLDCRGLDARDALPALRGVRGEIIWIEAPEVTLRRPVRLMHPRYSIYIVPRRHHRYLVGATQIESDDAGSITVRSALELLSAAFSLHTGFAEARVLEAAVACRPAFADNLPRLIAQPGLLRINGLYRHGFLLAPVLVEAAVAYLQHGIVPTSVQPLWSAGP